MKNFHIKTVPLPNGICLSGYEGEYIFEKISKSQTFYEQSLLEKWFQSDGMNVVYDIGANIGNHSIYFATSATNVKVYSYEPVPENFALLSKNISDNRLGDQVSTFQVAVGENKGIAHMDILQDANLGTASIVDAANPRAYEVEVIAIDDLDLPAPDFIKIDVEGFELSVLKGMQKTLKKIDKAIVWIEVAEGNAFEVYKLMCGLGFGISALELGSDNNILWVKPNTQSLKMDDLFVKLLTESISNREYRMNLTKQISRFTYEQKKANDLTEQVKSTASKLTYEQNKANDLTDHLKSMTSKFTYEQKKANDLTDHLKSMTSKFTYEQSKVNDLTVQLKCINLKFDNEQNLANRLAQLLESMTSKFDSEHRKTENLFEQLKARTSNFIFEQRKAENLLEQLKARTSNFIYEQRKAEDLKSKLALERKKMAIVQAELDKYRNSKLIRFMCFCFWRVPAGIRRRVGREAYKCGRWLYVKLLPHPRVRRAFSKINSKLRIFKNPQAIVSPQKNKPTLQNVKEIVAPQERNFSPPQTRNRLKVGAKTPREMNVAMIVDEFSYNSLRFECNAFPLEPENWREIFENNAIDFFFCESAWTGVDSIKRPWRGIIYASTRFPKENRGVLLEIIGYCKSNNIPTVFWNKEDPAHYEDRAHDFVKTALEFDHIFTTASECVERYKSDYGHKSVHLLMFATQPRLFNPIERYSRTEEVIFAGSWYRQHPSRCDEMGKILDAIMQSPYPLKIYNRQSENDDPNHVFPEKYLPYVHPRLPHDQLDMAYKASKYALNINTVTGSETMFARRVFELMSSNTLVLSNHSIGMEHIFGDDIVILDGSAVPDLSKEAEMREKCLYTVLSHHTYKQRLEQILGDIALDFTSGSPLVSLYYRVEKATEAQIAINHFHRMNWGNKRGILVVDEGCAPEDLQNIVCMYNSGMVTVQSAHYNKTYHSGTTKEDSSGYRINATVDLCDNFIKKAIAHVSYLDSCTAIATGMDKYRFSEAKPGVNMLIAADCTDEEIERVYIV